MLIHVAQTQKQGRTFIWFAATPKSPETRALLAQFKKGVRSVEKKWKAAAAKAARRQKRAGKRSRRRR
ncbi:MAG TPA: hypothetical protein VN323_07275 [Candidatus Dormibacteraeota bacterium]|jgi:hypothetical protein|nr:hypothetical protein [Candidatus Dormibacteraeota bacterium]